MRIHIDPVMPADITFAEYRIDGVDVRDRNAVKVKFEPVGGGGADRRSFVLDGIEWTTANSMPLPLTIVRLTLWTSTT